MSADLAHGQNRYGLVARMLHWAVAVLIFAALVLGFYMGAMTFGPDKIRVIGLHKSIGICVLVLAAIRLLWRAFHAPPLSMPTHTRHERFLAKTVHIVLYLCMFGMPLSGWVMSSAGEFSVNFFGLFELPSIAPKDEQVFKFARSAHELTAYGIIDAIGLHIIGAIKHSIIDRDATMNRMGASLGIAIIGLAILGGLFLIDPVLKSERTETRASYAEMARPVAVGGEAEVNSLGTHWNVAEYESRLGIQFLQYGKTVNALFSEWEADIRFDPEDLDQSRVMVRIDTGSLKTGSEDRDEQARDDEWFSTQTYPQAIFESESFTALGGEQYEVSGRLTLRGVTQPVRFPFSLEMSEENENHTALMRAEFSLTRLSFGVGQGSWSSTDTIADAVKVEIALKATRQ